MTDVLPEPVPSMKIRMHEPPPHIASPIELAIGAAVLIICFFLAFSSSHLGLKVIYFGTLGYAVALGHYVLPRMRKRADWYRKAADAMREDCEKIATEVAQSYAAEVRKEYAALYGEVVRERDKLRAKEEARARESEPSA
jgi:hypothetical protein